MNTAVHRYIYIYIYEDGYFQTRTSGGKLDLAIYKVYIRTWRAPRPAGSLLETCRDVLEPGETAGMPPRPTRDRFSLVIEAQDGFGGSGRDPEPSPGRDQKFRKIKKNHEKALVSGVR